MLAAQLFGTVGVAAVLLLAFATRAPRLLDLALVFAVLAAVAGVTLALGGRAECIAARKEENREP